MDSLPVFSEVVDQRCNDAFRILKRLAGLRAFNLLPQILFFRLVKGDELDAGTVSGPALFAPHQNAALLSVHAILEQDNARLERPVGLYPETGCAEVHDPGTVVRPLQIIERDDPEGTVALQGDRVPSQPFPLVVYYFSHEAITPPRESRLVIYNRLSSPC